jgi:hypothetical protein
MYDPYLFHKDPSAPIRKNVTFIPFRRGGTAGLVTGSGIAMVVVVVVVVKGPQPTIGLGSWCGTGNESVRFYL